MISAPSFLDFCTLAKRAERSTAFAVTEQGALRPIGKKEKCDKAVHIKTWNAFLRSMQSLCDQRHIDLLCKRYNIDLEQVRSLPLTVKLIRLFQYGLQVPSDYHMPNRILMLYRTGSIPFSVDKKEGNRWQEWGTFRVSPDVIEKTLYRIVHGLANKSLPVDAYIERLTRCITNCRLETGMWLPAHNGEWYRVTHTLNCKSLVAAVLEPVNAQSQLPALFLFRPSQYTWSEGAKWTTLDDLHPDIGSIGYEDAQKEIYKVMQDLIRKGRPIVGGGYSLGGVHLQLCAADYPLAFSKIYLFASPSIAKKDARRFAEGVNKWRGHRLPHPVEIYSYRAFQGALCGKPLSPPPQDMICRVGKDHLGFGAVHPDCHVHLTHMYVDANKKQSYGDLHRMPFLSEDRRKTGQVMVSFEGNALQRQLSNSLRGKHVIYYEKLRTALAIIIRPLVSTIDKVLTCMQKKWGVDPFKYQPV